MFGKNRIQYQNFDWKYISSQNFDIYYYDDNERLARLTAYYAESAFIEVSDLVGYSPYFKTKIYVYSQPAALRQSNLGLDLENAASDGGRTSFAKAVVEVSFSGSQHRLMNDVKLGIAHTFIYEMLYGGNIKEQLQSTYLMALPDWFIEGAAHYAAFGWSIEMDNRMRDLMLTRQATPSVLLGMAHPYAGQSVWNFIAIRYGRTNVANVLNLTRINRNEQTSITNTLGVRYRTFIREWKSYYQNMAEAAEDKYNMPENDLEMEQSNKGDEIKHLVYNPAGNKIAYTLRQEGVNRVIVSDTSGRSKKIIRRSGYKLISQNIDEQMPVISWRDSDELVVIDYEKGLPHVFIYSSKNGRLIKKNLLQKLDMVYGFDINMDGSAAVLSATQNGHTDLYLYRLMSGKIKQLTNSLYDEKNPVFSSNEERVFFSSNMPDASAPPLTDTLTSIPVVHNIFSISADGEEDNDNLQQHTFSPFSSLMPTPLNDGSLLFVNDENGIYNLQKLGGGQTEPQTLTNMLQNIDYYSYNEYTDDLALSMHHHRRDRLYRLPDFDITTNKFTPSTTRQDLLGMSNKRVETQEFTPEPVSDEEAQREQQVKEAIDSLYYTDYINIDHYVFESEKLAIVRKNKIDSMPDSLSQRKDSLRAGLPASTRVANPDFGVTLSGPKVVIEGPFDYEGRLTMNNVITNPINIDPLRGWGMVLESSITDLFENHKFRAGAYVNFNFRSNDFYAEYAYLKKRVDYTAGLKRSTFFYAPNPGQAFTISQRYVLNEVYGGMSYPLSIRSRVTAKPLYTQTRFVSLDSRVRESENDTEHYGGLKLEYVFDNSVSRGLNMLTGMRIKANIKWLDHAGNNGKSFGVANLDIRRYQKVHKNIIWATRLAYGSFFGPSPKNFLLGGMDNWIFNSTKITDNPEDPLSFVNRSADGQVNTDLLFTEYVTNMRGFAYNTLYGHSYLLLNTELRMPVVRYFYSGSITSSFLSNLQLTAFTDVGSAWTGTSPFTKDNTINTEIKDDNGFVTTVINYRNPFLTGYGFGIRSTIFSYYVKADLAWGIQDRQQLPSRFYLTMGYDF